MRATFPKKPYANLEHPSIREFSQNDSEGFLAQYPEGAIIDEIQRVPELTSYIQVLVDEKGANEIDLLIPRGAGYQPVEIKSGMSLSPSLLDRLKWFQKTFSEHIAGQALLIHPRSDSQTRSEARITNHVSFTSFLPEAPSLQLKRNLCPPRWRNSTRNLIDSGSVSND